MTLLMCSGGLFAQEFEPAALLLCESMPEGATVLGKVAANSRRSSARTSSGKQGYVMREIQRQGRLFGADALLLAPWREITEHKPQYGQRPGSMQYQKIVHSYGSGEAILLGDNSDGCNSDQ